MRKLLAEPMVHFLLIGVALFGVFRWRTPGYAADRRIVITQGALDDLITQHLGVRGRTPTSTELKNLVESYVHDEILYREGARLGLDRDDIVVRRRVRQKLEVMQEEEIASDLPTDADLVAYLKANRSRFEQPAILTFEQIFLGHSTSDRDVDGAVATVRDAVVRGANPDRLGRPTLLPHRMTRVAADLVARDFGTAFAEALEHAPVGEWTGPIDSSFGAHYVRVSERTPPVTPGLAAIRDMVAREWENARRKQARDDSYAKVRNDYQVIIEAKLPAE